MTTWLEFRSEPVSDVPEVKIELPNTSGFITIECQSGPCSFKEEAETYPEAEQIRFDHQKWHEDGMPE